jgi:hypothetical protein
MATGKPTQQRTFDKALQLSDPSILYEENYFTQVLNAAGTPADVIVTLGPGVTSFDVVIDVAEVQTVKQTWDGVEYVDSETPITVSILGVDSLDLVAWVTAGNSPAMLGQVQLGKAVVQGSTPTTASFTLPGTPTTIGTSTRLEGRYVVKCSNQFEGGKTYSYVLAHVEIDESVAGGAFPPTLTPSVKLQAYISPGTEGY